MSAAITVAALWSTQAGAVPTASFELSTFKAFDKGTPKGTLVSSDGEVVAGYGSRPVTNKDAVLMYWSRAKAADGTLYLGAGQPAKIYALKGGKLRGVAAISDAVLVSALAIGPGGNLLAGTLPAGRVLSVDPKSGKWSELGRLPSKHVWDLTYDAKARRIYAAGGAPGKLYAMPAGGGKPTVHYDAGEKHLLFVTRDGRGALLTGGSDKAVLYRVKGKGKAEAVHDFDATELRRAAVAPDGTIYAAVNKFRRRSSGLPRYDRPVKGKGGTAIQLERKGKRAKFLASELRPGAKIGQGAVFRITTAGRVTQLHSLTKGYFTDIAVDASGKVWAAEGAKGKIFLMQGDKLLTAFDVKQRQVLALDVSGKTKHFATGDAGAVYRITEGGPGRPSYLSDALDAKTVARWGNLRYRATAKLAISSRSGNTSKPDKTWSAWSNAGGQGKQLVRLKSKPARYLQIRATWQGKGGALRSLEAYYRPLNIPAKITKLSWERNAKKPEQRTIKFKWKVKNPDKDALVYRVYVREELGSTWRPLEDGKAITKAYYTWDTRTFADDTYRIKVEVSDERANGQTTTIKTHEITPPIVVDNRKPDVTGLKVRYPFATGLAKDTYSRVQRIEFSVDGSPWRLVDAQDGIYDSTAEAFKLSLPKPKRRGSHTLSIRVTDEAGNAGVRKLRFVK
ncbi:MAG: hypothetical protein CSB49_02630 [Proteobacteria bacterium]|nr:MAG: hypothetical protein CSB49_02630 [Pseudomonadota bacterium]